MSDTSSTNVSVIDPDFILYGHRGGGAPATDETVANYTNGIDWGADYIEPDLYLTSDGVLVCSHDDEGFSGETYAQALAKDPSLMTFDQLVKLVQQESIATGRNIGLIPELKDQSEAAAQSLINTLVANDFIDPTRVIIQSFGTQNLQWLHDTIMPAAGVNFQLLQLGGGESIATIQGYAAYANIYAPSVGSFTAADVAAAHAAGMKVVAWTITGAASEIEPLIQMGVDGVFENATNDARPALAGLQGAKVIYGTTSWDTISDASDTANTIIYGMDGDDIVRSGSGDNIIYGDAGNDVLFGGAGNDQLVGGDGTDFLNGGGGSNTLDGSAGNDVIVASGGDNTVVFQPGDGIALVEVGAASVIGFSGIASTAVTLINDGGNLILRAGSDALVIAGGADAANQPGTITFADGVTLTGSTLAAYLAGAPVGTDAGVDAALPGLNGQVVFQHGDGIELVSVDSRSTITFSGIASTDITGLVIDGSNLIVQIGSDELVLADGIEAEHQPGTITFADGVTLTGSDIESYIAAHAVSGADAAVDAALPGLEAKAQPVVATGNEVLFRQGDGIDLVVADHGTTINFEDISSTEISVIQDGANLIIQINDDNANNPNIQDVTDAVVIHGGSDAANLPAVITFADGVTWTGADLAAHAVAGTDATVDAALPGLDYVLAQAPGLATASTVAVGTDLVANDGLGKGKLSDAVGNVEDGAVYRLSFSLADLGGAQDAGVEVLWNGQVLWQGVPDSTAGTLHFEVDGGSGDGSNQLVFQGAGSDPSTFDATLSDVSFVKLSDPGVPVLDNHAPVAQAASLDISEALTYAGAVTATDADGDPLVYTLGDSTAHGTLKFNADGTYSYTPDTGFTGTDSFSYIVNDGHGGAAEAAITLTVKPGVLVGADLIVNGSFEDLSESTGYDGPGDWGYRNAGNPITGWTEVNGGRIEQHWDTDNGISAENGTIWVDMNGYQNNTDIVQQVAHVETGATYELSFAIADADSTAGVSDGIEVLWGGQVVWNGQAPASGWETITLRVVGGAGDGLNKLEFVGNQPNPTATTYGAALDNVQLIKLADPGAPVPDQPPVATDGYVTGIEDQPITGQLAATDPDGDAPLSYSLEDRAAHGTVVVNANGTFTYTADAGYTGQDAFTFQVDDGHGGTDIATETLTVGASKVIAIGTNLIVNGSFEDTTGMTVSPNGWGWYSSNGVPGWQDLSDVNGYRSEVHTNTQNGIGPKDGSNYFDLDGNGNNAQLVQQIAGVETGATYQLSFSVGDADGSTTDDGVEVLWGGQVIATILPTQVDGGATWQTYTFTLTGGSGDGSNKLEFIGTETDLNWYGAALDAVSFVKTANAGDQDLIANGDFEDHTGLTQTSTGWTNANGALPGWTDASGGAVTVNTATLDTVAPSGSSDFDLDQNGGNAKISQVVQGVETGATYTLTFSIAGLDSATATGKAATDSVKVYWGGQLIYSGTPENIWQTMTIDVVGGAGDGSNTLEFDGAEATPNGVGVGLDNVSLVKIDENPNLIVNGSFEDLTGAYDGNHPTAVPGNSPDWGYRDDNGKIAGWTQTNTAAGGRAELHFDTQNGAASESGNVWFDLDGNGNNAHLVQTVAGVQSGQTYQLQFWIRDADGTNTDDGVKVYWGGQLIYTGLPTKTWEQITLQVTGGAGNGSNQLEFDGNETKLSGTGAALDNVSLRLIDNPNLIVNGSFEDLSQSVQNGTTGSADWGYRNEGNPITGWTEVNGGRIEQHWDTDNGISAQDGDIWVDMNGYQNNTDIVQSVAGVETGETYQLSFGIADADSTAGVADGIEVLWGGQVVWNGEAPASGWETITLDVVGGAGNGLNKLEFVGTQPNPAATTYGAALDNVSLTLEDQTPITGTDGDDTLTGTASADLLIGGKGNDTLAGGAGSDTYRYSAGDGSDTIVERAGASGTDVLSFTDLSQGGMVFHQHGQDVEVELQDGSVITLQDQLAGDGAGIELVAFADGTALNASQIAADLTDRAPVITSGTQSASLSEWADGSADEANNTPHGASGAVTFTDADTGDTHTATVTPEGDGYLGTFTLDPSAIDTTGAIGWNFSVDERSIDFLRAGQTLTQTYDVTVDDGLGGTATQTVTVTITGVNDLPVATPDTAAIRAHQAGSFDLVANDTDAEDGKPSLAGFSVTSVSGINLSTQAAAASFRIVDGKLAFMPSNVFNLAEGQQATLTLSYTAEDSEGGTATGQFTLTVTGDVITGPQYGSGTIQGSSAEDVINALGYNNTIYTNGGDDVVNAGQGQATVYAASGNVAVALNGYNDLVQGYNASGAAAASGADGNDSVSGSQGNTKVDLGNGQDTVVLGGYNNTVVLGNGADTVNAGLGNGVVTLGDGNDQVTLSGYSNTVAAGSGNDIVSGAQGSTTVTLGNGNDQVTLSGYSNVIVAGNGQDTIVAGAGSDQVTLGSGNDTVTLAGWSNQVALGAGTDLVHGGSGDTITITGTALTLQGGASETVFLGSGPASLDDLSSGTLVKVSQTSGSLSVTDFAKDSGFVLDLTGGVGGYKTAASVVNALQSDGHGGTLLMLGGSANAATIDFVNTTKDALTAAHFRIG